MSLRLLYLIFQHLQWQIQIQARIQTDAHVVMHTSYLTGAELAAAHLEQTTDVADAVRRALGAAGPNAQVCVLPEGPQTIPYIAQARRVPEASDA